MDKGQAASRESETAISDDQAVNLSLYGNKNLPDGLQPYDNAAAVDDRPVDFDTGLVDLGFITAAIRRGVLFCGVMAVIGTLVGVGFYVAFPAPYQAAVTILLAYRPDEDPSLSILDDQVVASSRPVAALTMRTLGLHQSVSSFLTTYTVTMVTQRVLLITVSAQSDGAAVDRANAVAAEFLRFRANQLESGQKLLISSLGLQVSSARNQISSLSKQISQLSAQPASASRNAMLTSLRTRRSRASTELINLEQASDGNRALVDMQTTAAITNSEVLDAAYLLPRSRLKHLLLYPSVGLILGLALGIGIVVARAITSDRLRRRDDVAYALGAPVKLSIGTARPRGRLQFGRRLAAHNADVERIAAHLSSEVPEGARSAVSPHRRPASGLAVVPVDDPHVAAESVVSLALSSAQRGKRVILADLCDGAPAARLLGVDKPGVHEVYAQNARLVVAIPDRDDVVPVGPLDRGPAQRKPSRFTAALAAADSSAELLTLTTLDPSLGGEHLATWATTAVAVVTAGRSSMTRIHAVGEMIRLAGASLVSAVLVGADKNDESLGMPLRPGVTGAPEAVHATEITQGLVSS